MSAAPPPGPADAAAATGGSPAGDPSVRRLVLQRYGALEDSALDLGAGLTVVLGVNEAGKSTTAAALTDLLWGLPLKHPLTSLLPRNQVRLRAVLGDGRTVVRLGKGLVAEDGVSAVEHPWGADGDEGRRSWETAFNLDHLALRAGGSAVFSGTGDLAELVFGARRGRGVHELLERLDARADALYKAHAGNKKVELRLALAAHDAARAQLADATTRASDVVAAEQRADAARAALGAAREHQLDAAREVARRREQQRCLADGLQLLAVREELARWLAAGDVLDAVALAAHDAVTADLESARTERAELEARVARWTAERAGLSHDPALLADAEEVEALHLQAQARAADRERAAGLAAEADAAEARAETAVRALEPVTSADGAAVPATPLPGSTAAGSTAERGAALVVAADLAAQLDDLALEHPGLVAAQDAARAGVERARALVEAHGDLGQLPDPALVQPVAESVRALDADGSPTARWRGALDAAEAARGRLAARLEAAGHQGASGVLDGAADEAADGAPTVPSAEDVDEAGDALTAAAQQRRDAERRVEELRLARASAAEAVTGATAPGVDPAVLVTARAERDLLWQRVREVWLDGGSAPAGGAEALAADHERALAEERTGTDELLRSAEQVAELAERRRVLAETTTSLEAAEEQLRDADAQHTGATAAWDELWGAHAAAVPPPARAAVIRQALEEARAAHLDLLAHTGRARRDAAEVARWAGELAGQLTAAGRPRGSGDGSQDGSAVALDGLLEAARALVAVDDAARESRQLRAADARALAEAERVRADAEQALTGWLGRWQGVVTAAGLLDVLTPAGWRTRSDLVTAATTALAEAAQLRQEAGRLTGAWDAFAAAVEALDARHRPADAPDGAGSGAGDAGGTDGTGGAGGTGDAGEGGAGPGALLERLWARVARARADRRSADEKDAQLHEAAPLIAAAAVREAEAAATLGSGAGTGTGTEVGTGAVAEEVLTRSRRVAELVAREEQLVGRTSATLDAGHDLEEVLGSLVGLDASALDLALTDADAAAAQAQDARDQAQAAVVTAEAEATALSSGAPAAVLRAQEQQRLAALAELAEQYAVVHLQRTVLRRHVEEHARRHSSPLLHQAGELLEQLTGGRWVGLQASDEGPDRRTLEVVRADGEAHGPGQLSEGTADQVYLALRLAGAEQLRTERRALGLPALPLVLDDALMTFDDERARAALAVLADGEGQVLLFTHHQHVADLAAGLGREDVEVARIGGPSGLSTGLAPDALRRALSGAGAVDAG